MGNLIIISIGKSHITRGKKTVVRIVQIQRCSDKKKDSEKRLFFFQSGHMPNQCKYFNGFLNMDVLSHSCYGYKRPKSKKDLLPDAKYADT